MRRVLATAGHVDHGKSTLVRALTGRDPDRLAEEQRRGLTIDLGFAWTTLPSGAEVAFVDVPGHRRFVGTMLAGLGPAPGVVLVVAADQGWQAQTSEHLDAVVALGVEHLLLVVTRADLADPDPTLTDARTRLAERGYRDLPTVVVAPPTGVGMAELRTVLDDLTTRLPTPDETAPVRMWVDRAFTIGGAGTVVTGTLDAGTLTVGDPLLALGADGRRHETAIRGLHSQDEPADQVRPASRAAVNVRHVDADTLGRGAVLLTPGAWELATEVDVALTSPDTTDALSAKEILTATEKPLVTATARVVAAPAGEIPELPTLHVGTADHEARVRPLGERHARVRTEAALPWRVGDRLLLRDPGTRRVWGATVVDVAPLPFERRGAARARGEALAAAPTTSALRALRLAEHRVQRSADLARLGLGGSVGDDTAHGATGGEHHAEHRVGDLVVDGGAWSTWVRALTRAVDARRTTDPLSGGLARGEVADVLDLPAGTGGELVPALAAAAGLRLANGRVQRADDHDLGAAETGVAAIEGRLRADPFAAPEADELRDLGLGAKELAAAVRTGRLLRLPGEVVLLPDAPARAMRVLAGLDQPFTLSAARQALGTTRRVAVPLLEHLDGRGWTRRVDTAHREVVR